ncbi:hypothetical protein ACUXQ2_005701, partial [Cupriavidus metallidurans]
CPTARNIGDGRCRSRPSITVLAHPSNLVLTHNPSVLAELNAFSPELAKIYHINLEDQRKKLAAEAIATQARRKGIDAFEVWLEHAIESPSERTSILERRQELIRAALGN